MLPLQGAGGEAEALTALEGGCEEAPQQQQPQPRQQQPTRLPRRRLAAAAAAALALAALGLVAYLSPPAGASADAAAADAAPAGSSNGGQPDIVRLFGEYGTNGGCQCDCGWASTPNACHPRANDGGCCWSTCCGGAGGGYVVDNGYGADGGSAYVVVDNGQGQDVHTDGYYPSGGYADSSYVVVHHHYGSRHYHYDRPNSICQYFPLYAIGCVLLVSACVGIWYLCCRRKA